jgi:hypothetical protein
VAKVARVSEIPASCERTALVLGGVEVGEDDVGVLHEPRPRRREGDAGDVRSSSWRSR